MPLECHCAAGNAEFSAKLSAESGAKLGAELGTDVGVDRSADVSIGDLGDLFSAVKSRLRTVVGEDFLAACLPELDDPMAHVRAGVLECVAALDQLHLTLTNELARRHQLEEGIAHAQSALEQAQAELVDSQADEREARHRSLHDGLTSLPNAGFFRDRLDDALAHTDARYRTVAVLYLDLDGFKPINDAHGHDTGDEALRIVAARLNRAVRSTDMVGRLGGDEFACLLAGAPDRERLSEMACTLLDAVSAPLKIGKLQLTVRPSIGIAMCPGDGSTTEALLRSADAAMYRAKRQKSGYAFFDERADVWANDQH